jgi:hydrogenase expression/formation protein HypC
MCLGLPGRLTAMADSAGLPMGTVDFDGTTQQVCLAYLPEAQVGDYVLVNARFAIRLLDPAEARSTLALLRSLPGPPVPGTAGSP